MKYINAGVTVELRYVIDILTVTDDFIWKSKEQTSTVYSKNNLELNHSINKQKISDNITVILITKFVTEALVFWKSKTITVITNTEIRDNIEKVPRKLGTPTRNFKDGETMENGGRQKIT